MTLMPRTASRIVPAAGAAREPAASALGRDPAGARADPRGALATLVQDSPRLVVQRRQLEATFGPAIQRETAPDRERRRRKAASGVAHRVPIGAAHGAQQGRVALASSGPPVVQRVVGPDLDPGTRVVDDRGRVGRIVGLAFNPRQPNSAYDVQFGDAAPEEVPFARLDVAGTPVAEPSAQFDEPTLGGESEEELGEGTGDDVELLAPQRAAARSVVRRAAALERLRPGKSPKGRDLAAAQPLGARVAGFVSRTKGELVVDPRAALRERHYSDRGAAAGVHRQVTALGDATIGNPMLTPVESLIVAPVGALVGTHRRAGRTPGTAAKLEQKAGHVFSALGALLQTVPLIGAAGAPASGVGAFLQEHAKGASKKQAAVRAVAATGAGAVAGLIPGYGTYSGTIGLVNECRKLFSSVEQHGDPKYAHALLERMDAAEELAREIEDALLDEGERRRLLELVDHELMKARRRFAKEMRRRENTQRGRFGEKTALLEEDRLGSLEPADEGREDDAEGDLL